MSAFQGTIYETATGVIVANLTTGSQAEAETNLSAGQGLIAGLYAANAFTIVSGAAVAGAPKIVLTSAQLAARAYQVWTAFLAAGQTFNVAASGAPPVEVLCDGTQATLGVLALFALFGQANPNGTKAFRDNNGVTTQLTGSELVTLATLVGTWSDNVYAAYQTLEADMTAGSIATYAAIAAFAWPTS